MTHPPFTPVYENVNRGSAATFRPTCFITAMDRLPAKDAPKATSRATFSFGHHSAYTWGCLTTFWRISVDGVPGYPAATFTPASKIPSAIASLPESSSRILHHLDGWVEGGRAVIGDTLY